jgi:hypothetical protein
MWVLLALGAGLLQSVRNGFARSLSGAISPVLNSWARFAFNLPFSTTLVSILVLSRGAPETSFRFYWKESEVVRQIPGMVLTLAGIVLVLMGGRAS